jgi:hypothetical protein
MPGGGLGEEQGAVVELVHRGDRVSQLQRLAVPASAVTVQLLAQALSEVIAARSMVSTCTRPRSGAR